MVNVKASNIRYGLSRFWLFKASDNFYHSKILSIYINEITKNFFTANEFIQYGFAYDYSLVRSGAGFLDVEIFVQDSAFEELHYITRGFPNPFSRKIFFPNYNKRKISFIKSFFTSLKYFFRSLKRISRKTRRSNFKTIQKPNSIFSVRKFKKIRFEKISLFYRRPRAVFFCPYKDYIFYSKKILHFFFVKHIRRVRQNQFRSSFFDIFPNFLSRQSYFSSFKYKRSFLRRSLKIFKFFSKTFLLSYPISFRNSVKIARINLFHSGSTFQKFITRKQNFIRKNYSRYFSPSTQVFFNHISEDDVDSFSGQKNFQSAQTYHLFANKAISRKFFFGFKYRIKGRFSRIKYMRRHTFLKDSFFSGPFSVIRCPTNFLNRFFASFLFPNLVVRKFKITRMRYYITSVSAYVFYSIVKLYYKYMLNDVIKPIIRGVSRYYTGFFVMCKGRFTRAQIASKKLFHRRFVYYNRLFWPLYYSYGSVALRYGASTVHIWIHH